MRESTGIILLAQESRIRLLRDDGRGLVLALAPGANIEPQDLPPLVNRRVRVDWEAGENLLAGSIHRIELL